MAAVIMDTGKLTFLNFLSGFGGTSLIGVTYHLYVNNQAPTHQDTLANYVEASFPGYVAQTVGPWFGAVLSADFHAQAIAALLTFQNTSGTPTNVFGYFVTNAANNQLLFAERFAGAPLTIPGNQSLTLGPEVQDTSEF